MLDLSQPRTARHQLAQFGVRAVGRAVVDVDDLKADVLAECGRDLVDQRGDVTGLVAHRNDDRNSRRGCASGRFAHGLSDMAASRLASWLSASFLWGDKLPGNPFDACERRTEQWPNDPVPAEHEGKPARRIPIAHQQRADRTDEGPDHDVARKCAVSTTRLT